MTNNYRQYWPYFFLEHLNYNPYFKYNIHPSSIKRISSRSSSKSFRHAMEIIQQQQTKVTIGSRYTIDRCVILKHVTEYVYAASRILFCVFFLLFFTENKQWNRNEWMRAEETLNVKLSDKRSHGLAIGLRGSLTYWLRSWVVGLCVFSFAAWRVIEGAHLFNLRLDTSILANIT